MLETEITLPQVTHIFNVQFERLNMMQELTRMAIESLPHSTDADVPIALLTGMQEMIANDSFKMYRLFEQLDKQVNPMVQAPAPQIARWPMAEKAFTPTPGNLSVAYSYFHEEIETMLCLAICLQNHLEPKDPDNPEASEDIIAWRLSQVLHERLTNRRFSEDMRELLLGSREAPVAEGEVCHG